MPSQISNSRTNLSLRLLASLSAILMFVAGWIFENNETNRRVRLCKEFIIRGNEQFRKGNYLTAESMYKDASLMDAKNPTVKNNLGVVLSETSKFREAESVLREAIALDPKNPIAHYVQAKVLIRLGCNKEALEQARIAVELDPTDPIAYKTLHLVALVLNDEGTARDALEKWNLLDPPRSQQLLAM